jgi:parallel beta-helix repeat protein
VPKAKNRIPWNAWGETHPGKQRDNNEDRIHCDPRRGIFIVVDGMGGEAAGEEAAQSALACIRKRLAQETGTIPRRIREAITAANNEIYRLSQSNPAWRGMACVLTTAVIEDGSLHIGHVGDTRLYTIRNHEIHKVTPDHSPIGRREDAGELTELEAMRHPRRNEVYRDVGSKPHKPDDEDFIEYIQIPFTSDSAVLICSDGLTDMLASTEILKAVERNAGKPRAAVRELIELANHAGGKDNVSAIIVNGEEFALAAHEDVENLSRPGAYLSASAGSLKRRLFRMFRALSRPWCLFIYGLVCGIVALSLLLQLHAPPDPGNAIEPQPAAMQPRTWHVDPASAEFGTIGRALERAQPGDRVEIAPGEYRESIRLKEGVSVVAQSFGSVILRVPHSLAGDEAVVVADGIKGGDLSGIVIKEGLDAAFPIGIRIVNSDLRVLNVEVSGAAKAGIWIDGDSAALMIGNYIHGNPGTGVVVAGFSKPRLLNNIIQNNGGDKNRAGPGIHIIETAEPDVQRNVISGNAAEGIRLRQVQMKDKMMNNIFAVTGKPNKAGAIGVEKTGIR